MRTYRVFLSSFLDGFTSAAGLFAEVKRPGSSSAELEAMTTPDMLAAYGKVNASLPGRLRDLKEKEHKRDVAYARLLRVNGVICLLALAAALVYAAVKR